jgi:hypothetical protein
MVVGYVELSKVLDALKPAELELGREINAVVYLSSEYQRQSGKGVTWLRRCPGDLG